MDEQFGGRTDDDLFADDFEPVDEEETPADPLIAQSSEVKDGTGVSSAAPVPPAVTQPAPQPSPTRTSPVPQVVPSKPPPRGSLANSRHNPNRHALPVKSPRQRQAPQPVAPKVVSPPAPAEETLTNTQTSQGTPSPAPVISNPPTGPRNANGNKPDPQIRLRSGGLARTKLTEQELAAKMEHMRIKNAEKTRRFEQAQRDESEHAVALAKGMEEARKRRALEEEKRRRSEEERRRMEDERNKNRERKLAAMGQKEGGWDEGKDALDEVEDRRVFRGANGGVRGSRTGLAGSRFASVQADDSRGFDDRREHGDRDGRRGGRGRGGRGGRGGFHDDGRNGSVSAPRTGYQLCKPRQRVKNSQLCPRLARPKPTRQLKSSFQRRSST